MAVGIQLSYANQGYDLSIDSTSDCNNCSDVEHAISLGILSYTILPCMVMWGDETRGKRKMMEEVIMSNLFGFWVILDLMF